MKPVFHDLTNPVTAAVLPLKEQAIGRAEAEARKLVDWYAAKLAEHGDDIRAAFPYPNSGKHGRNEYRAMRNRNNIAYRLTRDKTGCKASYRFNEPYYREMNPEGIERFVAEARDFAGQQYDAFVMKLVGKVGPVTEAKLHGTHVWGYSILTVRKEGDIMERWQTQQIVNQSVLGTLFNQWPTRKLKR